MNITDLLSMQQQEMVASFLDPIAAPIRDIQDSILGAKTDMTDSVLSVFGIEEGEEPKSKNKKKLLSDAGKAVAKRAVVSFLTGG